MFQFHSSIKSCRFAMGFALVLLAAGSAPAQFFPGQPGTFPNGLNNGLNRFNNGLNGFNNGLNGFNNGLNGFNNGLNGFNGGGGLGQQLAPQNLRNNFYFYNSVGGQGLTGGTVQIVTTFGLASSGGGNNAFNGGFNNGIGSGFGGPPAFFGANYHRQLAYRNAVLRAAQATPVSRPEPSGSFAGFGFPAETRAPRLTTSTDLPPLGSFNALGFDRSPSSQRDPR